MSLRIQHHCHVLPWYPCRHKYVRLNAWPSGHQAIIINIIVCHPPNKIKMANFNFKREMKKKLIRDQFMCHQLAVWPKWTYWTTHLLLCTRENYADFHDLTWNYRNLLPFGPIKPNWICTDVAWMLELNESVFSIV